MFCLVACRDGTKIAEASTMRTLTESQVLLAFISAGIVLAVLLGIIGALLNGACIFV